MLDYFPPRMFGEYKSPVCECCGSKVDATEKCQGKGVHCCEGMQICEYCITACSRCGDPFCGGCAPFSLTDGLCETCLDEIAAMAPKEAA